MEFKLPAAKNHPYPGPVRVALSLRFEARGAVVSHTINDTIDNLVNRIVPQRRIEKLSTARQLDQALTPRHTVAPRYPETLRTPAGSRIVLDFFVDETGRVRMPVLHAGDDHVLAQAATDALLEWRFDPPTRGGRPAIAAARQEFFLPAR